MKRILLIFLVAFVLSSCTLFPQKFDNHEYSMLVDIAIGAETLKSNCDDEVTSLGIINNLDTKSRKLELYTRHTPKNDEVYNVAKVLREDMKEFKDHRSKKGHSKFYCEIKAGIIHKKTLRILEAAGKKSRN